MENFAQQLNELLGNAAAFFQSVDSANLFTTLVRFLLPVLAGIVIFRCAKSLMMNMGQPETWAYLAMPTGERVAINHWENTIGRSKGCDVVLNFPEVSRTHAALTREPEGTWRLSDLRSKGGVMVNGVKVQNAMEMRFGDVISLAGVDMTLMPLTPEERAEQERSRPQPGRELSPILTVFMLTMFQLLTALQLFITVNEEYRLSTVVIFLLLIFTEWAYLMTMRILRRTGVDVEILLFLLTGIGFGVAASAAPAALTKQFIAFVGGVALFVALGWFLRDLERTKKIRWLMVVGALGLFALNLVLGATKFGSKNWIDLGFITIQPSEFVKVAFVYVGAATLDKLLARKNLILFIAFTGVCAAALALMGDFGAALIFFGTFVVIAFIRSGDWATLALICTGAAFAGLIVLKIKPYIANRFAAWGHVWEYSSSLGYQQTRAMSAAASGGLFGVGAGNGWLVRIGAADTDLVFGVLCEEWGLLIAVMCVAVIAVLAVFAFRCSSAGRSSFYVIGGCAATALLLVQLMLNIFGCMDILPLTGVTFPFVSNGGSSMMASWALMAFVKAADTRKNASFATPQLRKEETL